MMKLEPIKALDKTARMKPIKLLEYMSTPSVIPIPYVCTHACQSTSELPTQRRGGGRQQLRWHRREAYGCNLTETHSQESELKQKRCNGEEVVREKEVSKDWIWLEDEEGTADESNSEVFVDSRNALFAVMEAKW